MGTFLLLGFLSFAFGLAYGCKKGKRRTMTKKIRRKRKDMQRCLVKGVPSGALVLYFA